MSWFYKGAQNLSNLNADYVAVSTLSVSGNLSLPSLSQNVPLYIANDTNVAATPFGTGGYLKATGGPPFFQLTVPISDVNGGTNNAMAIYTAAGVLTSSSGSGYPKLTAGVPAYTATVPISDVSGGSANRMAVFTAGGVLSSSAGTGYAKFATGVPSYATTVPVADINGGTNNAMAVYTGTGVLSSSSGTGYAKFASGVPSYISAVPISDISGGTNSAMAVYSGAGVLSSSSGTGYAKFAAGVPAYNSVVPIADVSGGTNSAMAVYTAGGILSSSSGNGYAKFTAGVPTYSTTIPAADITGAFSPGAITGGTPNALAVYNGSGILGSSSGNGYAKMTSGVPSYSATIPFSDLATGNNYGAAVYTSAGVLTSTVTPSSYPASGLDIAHGQVLYAPDNATVPRWSTGPITNTVTARTIVSGSSLILDTFSNTLPNPILSIQNSQTLTSTSDVIAASITPTLSKSSGGTVGNLYGMKITPQYAFSVGLTSVWGLYIDGPVKAGLVDAVTAVGLRVLHPNGGATQKAAAWLESLSIGTGAPTVASGEVQWTSGTRYGTLSLDSSYKLKSTAAGSANSIWTQPTVGANPQWLAGGMLALCPPGAIIAYGGRSAPTGWFLCDGAAYPIATYSALAAALLDPVSGKYAYGCDSLYAISATNFYVPDLRGKFIRGTDLRGATGSDPDYSGRTINGANGNTTNNPGSQQPDAYRTHTHTTNKWMLYAASGPWTNPAGGTVVQIGFVGVGAPSGGNVSNFETRPFNVYCTYIIKY